MSDGKRRRVNSAQLEPYFSKDIIENMEEYQLLSQAFDALFRWIEQNVSLKLCCYVVYQFDEKNCSSRVTFLLSTRRSSS